MDKIYIGLSKQEGESLIDYDKRINSLKAQHIGYAFFRSINYNASNHQFSVYIVWNGKFNQSLNDPMPDGGFVIHCSEKEAMELCKVNAGVKIYSRLYSCEGRLTARDIIVFFNDKKYVLSFTGVSVSKPEMVCFMDVDSNSFLAEDDNEPVIGEFESNRKIKQSGSFNIGSFRNKAYSTGSFLNGSYTVGSFNISSFNIGSHRIGSFNASSFNIGSFNLETLSKGSFNIGSYTAGSFSIESFLRGSYSVGSYVLGSFSAGLYNNSSTGSFNIGSYDISSFNLSSFNIGSYSSNIWGSYSCDVMDMNDTESFPYEKLLCELFGIGKMGYGLNLLN